LILSIKILWDGFMDPIMAYITDRTRSRWGRRRPYILVGGVSRIALLLLIVAFMPTGGNLTKNAVMEAQKHTNEAIKNAASAHRLAVQAYEQIEQLPPDHQALLLDTLEDARASAQAAKESIQTHYPELESHYLDREEEARARREALAVNQQASPGSSEFLKAEGLVVAAEARANTARELLDKSIEARRQIIAARLVSAHLLEQYGREETTGLEQEAAAREAAAAAFAEAGIAPIADIFAMPERPSPKPGKRNGVWTNIANGVRAFWAPENLEQRPLIIYTLVAVLLFTTLTTVQSVPYYALGIEISPSYNGRTQVVTYRGIMNQIAGLLQPWVPVFCFSLLFATALDGLFWVALLACAVGIPSTIIMCWFVRERTEISSTRKENKGFMRNIWQVMHSVHFIKIFALYWLVGLALGVFSQIGFYLNVYWVMGSALAGAKLGAWVSMVAWGLGFFTLPLINWGCRRFQKHRMMQFAILWMSIGTALKWWCMNPDHPEYQFILPFFFSVGISSVYTILPTMMADVTDVDELKHGQRREGMFGAVMAFLMKMIGTFTPVLAGAVLVMSGFDPALEYEQAPGTILNMRLMYSFVSAGLLLVALLILRKYPLTRERVQEIKAELHRRHLARLSRPKN
jgi:glycoside/pentoside/hexuronide:cation symporter, GPH family